MFGLGVVLLAVGSEALIHGALAVAKRAGVSALLSGLIIAGFGTSTPELVVSIDAALSAEPDIAIGNVIGSNIGNVLLILGCCALIAPLAVKQSALRRDAIAVIAASVLFLLLSVGNELLRTDATILLLALATYLTIAYRGERIPGSQTVEAHHAEGEVMTALPGSLLTAAVMVIGGLALIIGGSHVLLLGAVGIATQLGISEAIIGLIFVAMGTSTPELAVSVVAAFRRQADVAIGNILGSNVFNILGILGVSAILQPLPIATRVLQFDQWVMLGSSVLLFVFLYTGRRLSRLEGGVFILLYGLYVALTFTVIPT